MKMINRKKISLSIAITGLFAVCILGFLCANLNNNDSVDVFNSSLYDTFANTDGKKGIDSNVYLDAVQENVNNKDNLQSFQNNSENQSQVQPEAQEEQSDNIAYDCAGSSDPEDIAREKLYRQTHKINYGNANNLPNFSIYYTFDKTTGTLTLTDQETNGFKRYVQSTNDIDHKPRWFKEDTNKNKDLKHVVIEYTGSLFTPIWTSSWFSTCYEDNVSKFECSNVESITGLGNLDMSSVEDASFMFTGIGSEKSGFENKVGLYPNITDTGESLDDAFWKDGELNLNALLNGEYMFCLTCINCGFDTKVNISCGEDLQKTTAMFQKACMWFGGGEGPEDEHPFDLSNFKMSNVTDASFMFNCSQGCTKDEDHDPIMRREDARMFKSLIMGNINFSNLAQAASMFSGCDNVQSIDLWNTTGQPVASSENSYKAMFADDNNLENILVPNSTNWTGLGNTCGKSLLKDLGEQKALPNLKGGRGTLTSGDFSSYYDTTKAFVDGKLNPKALEDDDEKGFFTTQYEITPDSNKLVKISGNSDVFPQGTKWIVSTEDKTITAINGVDVLAVYGPALSQQGKSLKGAMMDPKGSMLVVEDNDYLIKSGIISADFADDTAIVSVKINSDDDPSGAHHEGESFGTIPPESGWAYNSSTGCYQKDFQIGKHYSEIISDWKNTYIIKPGMNFNTLTPGDGTLTEDGVSLYATWTPKDNLLTNPDLNVANPEGIFDDFAAKIFIEEKSIEEKEEFQRQKDIEDNYYSQESLEARMNANNIARQKAVDNNDMQSLKNLQYAVDTSKDEEAIDKFLIQNNIDLSKYKLSEINDDSVEAVEFLTSDVAPKQGSEIGQYVFAIDVSNPDASGNQHKEIMAYKVVTSTGYKLVVHSYGIICSNYDSCAYMFSNFKQCKQIDLKALNMTKNDALNLPGSQNFNHMFSYCQNMSTDAFGLNNISADNFDTTNVKDMSYMFNYCSGIDGSLSLTNFKTQNVVNMSYMFNYCQSVPKIIIDKEMWNTVSVLNMCAMFQECRALTCFGDNNDNLINCSSFDMSHCEDTSYMFARCLATQYIDVSWPKDDASGKLGTSNVKDMQYMFRMFRDDDTGEVTTNLLEIRGLDTWSTGSVKTFRNIFFACARLVTLDLCNFDTGACENMKSMFNECQDLLNLYGLNTFDTQHVKDMSYMFYNCKNLTSIDCSSFKTCTRIGTKEPYTYYGVEDMYMMFRGCNNVETISFGIYNYDDRQKHDGIWNTYLVKSYAYMFAYCYKLTSIDVSMFQTNGVMGNRGWEPTGDTGRGAHNFQGMFQDCYALEKIINVHYDKTNDSPGYWSDWTYGWIDQSELSLIAEDTSNSMWSTTVASKSLTFNELNYARGVRLSNADNIYNANNYYYGTSDGAKYRFHYFRGGASMPDCYYATESSSTSITTIHIASYKPYGSSLSYKSCTDTALDGWKTDAWPHNTTVTKVIIENEVGPRSMYRWFYGMTGLLEIEGLNNINTNNLSSMSQTFYNCSKLKTIDLSSFRNNKLNVDSSTSTDKALYGTFYSCGKLSTIYVDPILWDAKKASDYGKCLYTFSNCTNLKGTVSEGQYCSYSSSYVDGSNAKIPTSTTVGSGYYTDIQYKTSAITIDASIDNKVISVAKTKDVNNFLNKVVDDNISSICNSFVLQSVSNGNEAIINASSPLNKRYCCIKRLYVNCY